MAHRNAFRNGRGPVHTTGAGTHLGHHSRRGRLRGRLTEHEQQCSGTGGRVSTPDETFRATMRGRTPEGEPTTLIVTRQGLGRAGRTWLTFDGAITTTAVLTDQETERLIELLREASSAQQSR